MFYNLAYKNLKNHKKSLIIAEWCKIVSTVQTYRSENSITKYVNKNARKIKKILYQTQTIIQKKVKQIYLM